MICGAPRAAAWRLLRTSTLAALLRTPRLTATLTTSSAPPSPARAAAQQQSQQKERETPVGKHLRDMIRLNGPIGVSQFMRQALTNPLDGYYMRQRAVFGPRGDFVTSPEVSQTFGELIAIWFVSQWTALGQPSKVHILEAGPGRGTLLADMLRTIKSFPYLYERISRVSLVEASPALKNVQRDALGISGDNRNYPFPVEWFDSLDAAPRGAFTFLVAHEFFDALPVYKFELTENGWREIMVDIDESAASELCFRLVRAPGETTASRTIIKNLFQSSSGDAQDTTTALPMRAPFRKYKPGDRIEVSPETVSLAAHIAARIAESSGSALIIDYGRNFAPADSLRGVRAHKFVSPLSLPGETDVTADVDFRSIAEACRGVALPYGPVMQRKFLLDMGIEQRLAVLQRAAKTPKETAELKTGVARLIDPLGMGKSYQFMAITPLESDKVQDIPIPVGFQ